MTIVGSPRGRSGFFAVWAWIWGALTAVVFVGVTVLTLGLWLTEPSYSETTPVADLSFFVLGMTISIGFISQVRSSPGVAGVQQAVLGALALSFAGAVGGRVEPLTGGLILLAAAAVLSVLHPDRSSMFRHRARIGMSMLVLGLLAAGPGTWQAVRTLRAATDAGASCFLGQCARGDRLAEAAGAAIAVVLLVLLASFGTDGWRLPAWTAAGGAALMGLASMLQPDAMGSLGHGLGLAALLWAVAVGVLAARRDTDLRPAWTAGRRQTLEPAGPVPEPTPRSTS